MFQNFICRIATTLHALTVDDVEDEEHDKIKMPRSWCSNEYVYLTDNNRCVTYISRDNGDLKPLFGTNQILVGDSILLWANAPVPADTLAQSQQIYYFEIYVRSTGPGGMLAIGLAPPPAEESIEAEKGCKLGTMPGWLAGSFAYHNDGEKYRGSNKGRGLNFALSYGDGDVVGCGWDVSRGVIFFTKNGFFLGEAFHGIFPALSSTGVSANTIGKQRKDRKEKKREKSEKSEKSVDAPDATAEKAVLVPVIGMDTYSATVFANFGDSPFFFSADQTRAGDTLSEQYLKGPLRPLHTMNRSYSLPSSMPSSLSSVESSASLSVSTVTPPPFSATYIFKRSVKEVFLFVNSLSRVLDESMQSPIHPHTDSNSQNESTRSLKSPIPEERRKGSRGSADRSPVHTVSSDVNELPDYVDYGDVEVDLESEPTKRASSSSSSSLLTRSFGRKLKSRWLSIGRSSESIHDRIMKEGPHVLVQYRELICAARRACRKWIDCLKVISPQSESIRNRERSRRRTTEERSGIKSSAGDIHKYGEVRDMKYVMKWFTSMFESLELLRISNRVIEELNGSGQLHKKPPPKILAKPHFRLPSDESTVQTSPATKHVDLDSGPDNGLDKDAKLNEYDIVCNPAETVREQMADDLTRIIFEETLSRLISILDDEDTLLSPRFSADSPHSSPPHSARGVEWVLPTCLQRNAAYALSAVSALPCFNRASLREPAFSSLLNRFAKVLNCVSSSPPSSTAPPEATEPSTDSQVDSSQFSIRVFTPSHAEQCSSQLTTGDPSFSFKPESIRESDHGEPNLSTHPTQSASSLRRSKIDFAQAVVRLISSSYTFSPLEVKLSLLPVKSMLNQVLEASSLLIQYHLNQPISSLDEAVHEIHSDYIHISRTLFFLTEHSRLKSLLSAEVRNSNSHSTSSDIRYRNFADLIADICLQMLYRLKILMEDDESRAAVVQIGRSDHFTEHSVQFQLDEENEMPSTHNNILVVDTNSESSHIVANDLTYAISPFILESIQLIAKALGNLSAGDLLVSFLMSDQLVDSSSKPVTMLLPLLKQFLDQSADRMWKVREEIIALLSDIAANESIRLELFSTSLIDPICRYGSDLIRHSQEPIYRPVDPTPLAQLLCHLCMLDHAADHLPDLKRFTPILLYLIQCSEPMSRLYSMKAIARLSEVPQLRESAEFSTVTAALCVAFAASESTVELQLYFTAAVARLCHEPAYSVQFIETGGSVVLCDLARSPHVEIQTNAVLAIFEIVSKPSARTTFLKCCDEIMVTDLLTVALSSEDVSCRCVSLQALGGLVHSDSVQVRVAETALAKVTALALESTHKEAESAWNVLQQMGFRDNIRECWLMCGENHSIMKDFFLLHRDIRHQVAAGSPTQQLTLPSRRYFSFPYDKMILHLTRLYSHIHSIRFIDSEFSGDFAHKLILLLHKSSNLTSLGFENLSKTLQPLPEDVLYLFAELPVSIHELSLVNCLTREGLKLLTILIRTGLKSGHCGIGALFLSNNGFRAEDVTPLCDMIRNIRLDSEKNRERELRSLRTIKIDRNKLGDAGCIALLKSVAVNPHVTFLHLADNGCGKQFVDSLSEQLISGSLNHLAYLDISGNILTDRSVGRLFEALVTVGNGSGLRTLILRRCNLSAIEGPVNRFFEADSPLQFLDLSANRLTEECGKEWRLSILNNSNLVYFYLSENVHLRQQDVQAIHNRCEQNLELLHESSAGSIQQHPDPSNRPLAVPGVTAANYQKPPRAGSPLNQLFPLPHRRAISGSVIGSSPIHVRSASTPDRLGVSPVHHTLPGHHPIQHRFRSVSPSPKEFPTLSVLFSAPLAYRDMYGQLQPIEVLPYQVERDLLKQCLRDSHRNIGLRLEFATTDTLRTSVTLGCKAVHYSGHGNPLALSFEDQKGGLHVVDVETLRKLFAAGKKEREREKGVQFVFVSACYSKPAGMAFVEAGVPHVVAVQVDAMLLDAAALHFTRAFYLSLAMGDTVRDAFDIGQQAVFAAPNMPHSEADKFLLLPEDHPHNVAIFPDAPMRDPLSQPELIDEPSENLTAHLPTVIEDFLGRNVEIYSTVVEILQRRFVTITGVRGIGKTAVAIATAHYLAERRNFPDGVFFISLIDAKNLEYMMELTISCLDNYWENPNGLPPPARPNTPPGSHSASLTDSLISILRLRKCLIIWDHCDTLFDFESDRLRQLIHVMLTHSKGVKLLATCSHPLGGIPGFSEKIISIGPLTDHDSARLFVRLCPRQITPEEAGVQDRRMIIQALSRHPLIQGLSGSPLKIAEAAYSFAAPDRTLRPQEDPVETVDVTVSTGSDEAEPQSED
eukprot:GILJ01010261.1.p1 GENE.GILJ01010261.1~~GILJ01010261.1.p1  ORF type:complete len:2314 (-),score=385.58 GILJ01010261.1:161-7102(-)